MGYDHGESKLSVGFEEIFLEFADLDLTRIEIDRIQIDFLDKNSSRVFENITSFCFALLYKIIYYDKGEMRVHEYEYELPERKKLLNFFCQFIDRVKFNIIVYFISSHGEKASMLKSFLHWLFEIKEVYLEYANSQNNGVINADIIEFERINYLMRLFDERLDGVSISIHTYNSLKLIYSVRIYLFALLERVYEWGYWLIRKTKLSASIPNKNQETFRLFKQCKNLHMVIPTYEFERVKYLVENDNWYHPIKDLKTILGKIEEKNEAICKQFQIYHRIKNPYLIREICLYILETRIEKDSTSAHIKDEFQEFLSDHADNKCEKTYYLFAKYLDEQTVAMVSKPILNHMKKPSPDMKEVVNYYFKSINNGHKYLWQTLPRVLEIWFERCSLAADGAKTLINNNMKDLNTYKIAQVLQILLSRFSNPHWFTTIVEMLAQLVAEYPLQSCWWLFHYQSFHSSGGVPDSKSKKDEENRKKFVSAILKRVLDIGCERCKTPLKSREEFTSYFSGIKQFFEHLIQFAMLNVPEARMKGPSGSQTQWPSSLRKFAFDKYKILMPIEENLRPRLPKKDEDLASFSCYKKVRNNYHLIKYKYVL